MQKSNCAFQFTIQNLRIRLFFLHHRVVDKRLDIGRRHAGDRTCVGFPVRTERIPVIQVILRKVVAAAANGNIRVQQIILSLVTGAEADRRVATMELLNTAVDYKEHWHHVLAERARKGTTGPEPVPHPDDVIIVTTFHTPCCRVLVLIDYLHRHESLAGIGQHNCHRTGVEVEHRYQTTSINFEYCNKVVTNGVYT